MLLLGAAFALPVSSPAEAQQPVPTSGQPPANGTGQPAIPPTTQSPDAAAAAQPDVDTGDEESAPEIVVVGAKPRGSVIGDIPPENTLDARDVRATGATSINELLRD